MKKYAFFTADGIALPVAYHLQEEGQEVYVGQVNDWKKLQVKSPEKPKDKEKRLAQYNGLLKNKWDADRLLSFLLSRKDKDSWFVFCDFNFLWPYGERLSRAGFRGLLPTKEDMTLEKDRERAKRLVKERYDMVTIGEYKEFKRVEEGLKYLDKNADTLFVLKGFNSDAPTIVPDSSKVEVNHLVIVDGLERFAKELERDGYIIEEKIPDLIEFTPEAIAMNGTVLAVNVNIEHKMLGSRNGPLVGCAADLVQWQDIDGPIYEDFLEPIEDLMLRRNEMTIWDASIFWSPSRTKFFFGEYCFNRPGYNCIFSELSTFSKATDYFEQIWSETPLQPASEFGGSIRLFNIARTKEGDRPKELLIGNIASHDIWAWDIEKDKGKNYTIGMDKDVLVVTGSGASKEEMIDKIYAHLKTIEFDNGLSLQKHDWFDRDFQQNILHRYDVLEGLEL